MRATAHLTIHPFHEGEEPPAHVHAAMAEFQHALLETEIEPFGLVVSGEADMVLEAFQTAIRAAIEKGASVVQLELEVS